MIYLDTSVVVAYYCPEPLSSRAERLVRGQIRPSISDLTEVEFVSALSRKIQRQEILKAEADLVVAQFSTHLETNLYTRIPLERRHYKLARDLIGRFATSLRTLDALHLAVAASENLRLATADSSLARLAKAVGLKTVWLRVPKK